MKKMFLNVDMTCGNKDDEVVSHRGYINVFNQNAENVYTSLCHPDDLPVLIDKGIVREEWDLEFSEKDMLEFGKFVMVMNDKVRDKTNIEYLLSKFLAKERN